ncbi:MAG: hypothetical protein FWG78_01340 [Coriobacteriia bacterium]|nr:hypothetical protein [Coriobacteriia bacterium]
MQYLRARYYAPDAGRFITEDTYRGESGDPLTHNQYVYTANNPLLYSDPSGHMYKKLCTRKPNLETILGFRISAKYIGMHT